VIVKPQLAGGAYLRALDGSQPAEPFEVTLPPYGVAVLRLEAELT
jgi:hypothetical protein